MIGGVDTHKHTHYAAAIDDQGRLLGHREFPATDHGYQPCCPGCAATVSPCDRRREHRLLRRDPDPGADPGRRARRRGQPAQPRWPDAWTASPTGSMPSRSPAPSSGRTSTAIPKAKSGTVEVIRTLRVTRASAVKARTQAFNTLLGCHDRRPVTAARRTGRADQADPGQPLPAAAARRPRTILARPPTPTGCSRPAVKTALRDLARRWKALDDEIKTLNRQIESAGPSQLRPTWSNSARRRRRDSPGQFLVTAGDNPNGSAAKPPSPSSAASHPSQPAAAAPPVVTASAAAATAQPTAPSTSSPSCACATTNPPATTSNAAPPKA